MYSFILKIYNDKMTTEFIKQVFDYHNIGDNNYIFRVSLAKKIVLVDIFDNITKNRFNRYIFEFRLSRDVYTISEINNIFVNRISILSLNKKYNLDSNLLKFAYLFKLRPSRMVKYANTFLSKEFVDVLDNIINSNF